MYNISSMWWSPHKILSFNCLFNFIMGARGCGKSFGAKEFCIKQAIEKGRQFMLLRRTEVELSDAAGTFFDDVCEKFPEKVFRYHNKKFQVNEKDNETGGALIGSPWETIGHGAYLSGARRKKSVPYPKVMYIIFDEFIVPGYGVGKYLPDEVTTFLEFYETVARMRPVQVLFLANALTTINPYFLYFNLRVPKSKTGFLRVSDEIVIEIPKSTEYKSAKKETRFGKMIQDTEYGKYAIDNEFVFEDKESMAKKPGSAFYLFTLTIDSTDFGVYLDKKTDTSYITESVNRQIPVNFEYKAVTGRNSVVFKNRAKFALINNLVGRFERGRVKFETQRAKQLSLEMFSKII